MAELYDYLTTVTPDYDYTLNAIGYCRNLDEEGWFDQTVREFDGGNEEVVTASSSPYGNFELDLSIASAAIADIIIDLYYDVAKAKGFARSFKLLHKDGHTYVVKFRSKIRRRWGSDSPLRPLGTIILKIIGKVADA